MNRLLKSISFIFHPLIMPLLGVIFYFSKSPRFIPFEIIQGKLISICILTIILPILIYFLLKTLGKTGSIYLKTAQERILPLGLNSIIIYLILKRVFPPNEIIELYFFFVGILLSTSSLFGGCRRADGSPGGDYRIAIGALAARGRLDSQCAIGALWLPYQ